MTDKTQAKDKEWVGGGEGGGELGKKWIEMGGGVQKCMVS